MHFQSRERRVLPKWDAGPCTCRSGVIHDNRHSFLTDERPYVTLSGVMTTVEHAERPLAGGGARSARAGRGGDPGRTRSALRIHRGRRSRRAGRADHPHREEAHREVILPPGGSPRHEARGPSRPRRPIRRTDRNTGGHGSPEGIRRASPSSESVVARDPAPRIAGPGPGAAPAAAHPASSGTPATTTAASTSGAPTTSSASTSWGAFTWTTSRPSVPG